MVVLRFSKCPWAGVVQELGFKVTLQSKTWNCIHVFNGNTHAILLYYWESLRIIWTFRGSRWTDICNSVVTDINSGSSRTDICNSVVTDSNSI